MSPEQLLDINHNVNGLAEGNSKSSALAIRLLQSCAKPSIYAIQSIVCYVDMYVMTSYENVPLYPFYSTLNKMQSNTSEFTKQRESLYKGSFVVMVNTAVFI